MKEKSRTSGLPQAHELQVKSGRRRRNPCRRLKNRELERDLQQEGRESRKMLLGCVCVSREKRELVCVLECSYIYIYIKLDQNAPQDREGKG